MEKKGKELKNFEANEEDNSIIVSLNPAIYPLDIILSASYIFTDEYYMLIDGDPKEELIVEIRPKERTKDKKKLEKVAREFNNELINYANYALSAIRNQGLRQAIIERVMKTNSEEDKELEGEDDDSWLEDPEEIAKPWDEKYGESKDR